MSKSLDLLFERLGACAEAREWAKTQPSRKAAWANCKRSDWMLWIIARSAINPDDPKLRLMACDFAEAVLHLVPKGENRPAEAIRVARLFAAGAAAREDLDAAGAAAWAAARDAARAAAWAAARAAAGDAAWAAARAAAWAAAGDAARAAAGAAARAQQADIIRKYYPNPPKPTEDK